MIMIQMLPDGTLLVQKRYEDSENETIWDAVVEIKKDDPKYEEYLKQYQHDLEIIKMQKDILGKE